MLPTLTPFRSLIFGVALLGTQVSPSSAATLLWDSNGTTSPDGQDGGGAWLGANQWWDSETQSHVTWSNSGQDIAILGNGGTLSSANPTLTLGNEVLLKQLIFAPLHASNTQAYFIQGSSLNFGSNGRIEIQDGASSAGNNHRILMQSQMRGSDLTIQSAANANLALINFTGTNQWTGTLTLDGSPSTSSHGLFVQFSKQQSVSSLDKIVVKPLTTAVLTETGSNAVDWELSGTGAGSRGALRFDVSSTLTGDITLAGNTTLGFNPNATATLEGDISESGGSRRLTVTNQSSGNTGRTLILRGDNTFTGGFTLEAGVVRLESAGALNQTGANALTFQATSANTSHERVLVLGGYDLKVSGLNAATAASNSIIRNDSASDVTLTLQGTGNHTYTGTIADGTGAGKLALAVSGGATLNLSNANSYSGITTITNATLNVSHAQALGTSDGGVILNHSGSRLRLNNNIHVANKHFQGTYLVNASGNNTWSGTIQTLTQFQTTLESASGHFHISGLVEGKSVANNPHTVNLTGASTGEVSGVIQNVYQLTKQGTGSWLISGLNQYNSATNISGGNLQVGKASSGQTGTGNVTVSGATSILSGTGFVLGATTLNQGKILAGDAWGVDMGTLHFVSSLNLNASTSATVAEFTLGNQGAGDQWIVNGDLSLNSNSQLAVVFDSSYLLQSGDSWTLIDLKGNFLPGNGFDLASQLQLPDLSLLAGYNQHQWSVSNFGQGGPLTLSIISVPEPSRALLGMLALVSCIGWRKRRH